MSRLRPLRPMPPNPSNSQSKGQSNGLGRAILSASLLLPLTLTNSACTGNQEPSQAPVVSSRPTALRQSTQGQPISSGVWTSDNWAASNRWRQEDSWPTTPDPSALHVEVASAVVADANGRHLYDKNPTMVTPIASVTKLMTAMVVLDTGVSLNRKITIVEQDRDRLRNSRSRLRIDQARLSRADMMRAALVSSDNRAAHALARTTYRGGTAEFIKAMNRKARALGMRNTYFADSSGLDARNRSTAEDLVKMVRAAEGYPVIREAAATGEMLLYPFSGKPPLTYRNTNPLVRDPDWNIRVSKTGYINEAGRCLVMSTLIDDRRVYIVLLHGAGRMTPFGDSKRIRNWLMGSVQTASR